VENEIDDSIKALITSVLAGEASVQQQEQLQAWIRSSAAHAKNFDDYRKTLALSDEYYGVNRKINIDLDREWQHFISTVQSKELDQKNPVRKLYTSGSFWLKVAASVLIVITCGLAINFWRAGDEVIRFAATSDPRTVTLPDGSTIIINRNSTVSYTKAFGKNDRAIDLSGEAFFEITRDEQKPFIIHAGKTEVEVLGTSFNVLAYDSLDQTSVTVKTGVVKFSVPALNKEVTLNAGQKGVFAKTTAALENFENDDPNFLSWETREIVFTESDLKTVVAVLSKAYNVNIQLSAKNTDNCLVTARFDHQNLEAVLHVLQNTLNISYQINGNHVVITSEGC
jgi:transmembrane sensor